MLSEFYLQRIFNIKFIQFNQMGNETVHYDLFLISSK